MKTINTQFEDTEYIQLINKKGDRTWHDFILLLINWIDEPVLKGDDN